MLVSRRLATLAAIASITLAAGCASVSKAPPQADAEAKTFKPNPSVAQVYVYRNETLGAALSMPVTVNGKVAGSTGPNSYFKFDLPAGKHTITSQGDTSKLDLTVEAGKNYFVWQEVKMGFVSGNSKLQVVSEEVGRKGVLESTRIQSTL
jgi:hypothetical protein